MLVKKGNKNAMTLHKLLYQSYPRPNGTFVRVPKPDLSPYKIVVVDEISMVPLEMLKLLAKHKVFLICLGDPFQLPPIDKNTDIGPTRINRKLESFFLKRIKRKYPNEYSKTLGYYAGDVDDNKKM